MRYLVKDWFEHQHYKDRKPPWIKLKTDVFLGYEFSCLQDASKLLLIGIWTLASKTEDGSIPDDFEYIKGALHLKECKEIHFKQLIIKGFIIAIELLADSKQTATDSVSVSVSVSENKENVKKSEIELPDIILQKDWDDFLAMRRSMKKPLSIRAQEINIKKLMDWFKQGHNPSEILQNSIANNWQGLFEPKTKGKINGNDPHGNRTQAPGVWNGRYTGAVGSPSIHQGSRAASDHRRQVLADKVREREARRNAELVEELDAK